MPGKRRIPTLLKGGYLPRVAETPLKRALTICQGGWPETVLDPNEDTALAQTGKYVEEFVESDIETGQSGIEAGAKHLRKFAAHRHGPRGRHLFLWFSLWQKRRACATTVSP